MRQPGDSITEVVWEPANSYKALTDLATAKAVRTTVADLIRFALPDRPCTIFSLGIGTGALYKNFLNREIEEERIRVFGVESDTYLYGRCAENFPGNYVEASHFFNVEERCSSVIRRSLLTPIEIYEGTIDIVESRFTLQGLLYQKQIAAVLERFYRILRPGGMCIVSGIDCWMGSYIEKKVSTLRRFYNDVTIDPGRALIIGRKAGVIEFPVLDSSNHSDQDALKSMRSLTLDPLRKEGEDLGVPGWENFVNSDMEDGIKGRLWYRTKDEWAEMLRNAFGPQAQMKLITPGEFRNLYGTVHDSPFLIMITRP